MHKARRWANAIVDYNRAWKVGLLRTVSAGLLTRLWPMLGSLAQLGKSPSGELRRAAPSERSRQPGSYVLRRRDVVGG
jgi:hypothetical protein